MLVKLIHFLIYNLFVCLLIYEAKIPKFDNVLKQSYFEVFKMGLNSKSAIFVIFISLAKVLSCADCEFLLI